MQYEKKRKICFYHWTKRKKRQKTHKKQSLRSKKTKHNTVVKFTVTWDTRLSGDSPVGLVSKHDRVYLCLSFVLLFTVTDVTVFLVTSFRACFRFMRGPHAMHYAEHFIFLISYVIVFFSLHFFMFFLFFQELFLVAQERGSILVFILKSPSLGQILWGRCWHSQGRTCSGARAEKICWAEINVFQSHTNCGRNFVWECGPWLLDPGFVSGSAGLLSLGLRSACTGKTRALASKNTPTHTNMYIVLYTQTQKHTNRQTHMQADADHL